MGLKLAVERINIMNFQFFQAVFADFGSCQRANKPATRPQLHIIHKQNQIAPFLIGAQKIGEFVSDFISHYQIFFSFTRLIYQRLFFGVEKGDIGLLPKRQRPVIAAG